jgi:predicted CXXCH cytochrome family protein
VKPRPALLVGAALAAAVMLGLGLGLQVLGGKGDDPVRPDAKPAEPADASPPATPVGSAACAACHADQAAPWTGSHHQRAMAPADARGVLGAFDGQTVEESGQEATFRASDDGYEVELEGEVHRVAYAFGAEPLQQYLVERPDGRLQALPWAWDTRPAQAGGQRWFHLFPHAQPGTPLHWTGHLQTANRMCVECHVTGFELGYDAQADRFATRWDELGVGCEACHGPGSRHVAWAQAGAGPGDRGLTALVGRGSWARGPDEPTASWTGTSPPDPARHDGCWTCHALRTSFDPTVSTQGPFLDRAFPRLLDGGAYHPDGQIDAEVFVYGSFTQSKMFREGVGCADCHEPHGLGLRAQGNALCAQCHDPGVFDAVTHHRHPAGSEGAQCVACHMPAKVYMGNDPRRDHRMGIPRPDLSARFGTPNACTQCHDERDDAWAAEVAAGLWPRLGERPSFAEALVAGRAGAALGEAKLLALAADSEQPALARATALTDLPGVATPASLPGLEASVRDRDPLVRAAAARALAAFPPAIRWRVAGPLLADPLRAVRQEAARLLATRQPPPSADPSAYRRALSELEASHRADASRPEGRLNLANLLLRLGRAEEAEAELRAALKLDPTSVPARLNLADVLRATGRDADGEALLREARDLEPENGDAAHALGLYRIRRGDKAAALEELREAVGLAPERSRYAFVLALALQDQGETLEALGVLEEAHRRRPADLQVLRALAEAKDAAGDRSRAIRLAAELVKRLPGDPSARQLLDRLRQGR